MENSDNNRSTDIPIRVTVKSELESTRGDGMYTKTADGFVLAFSTGRDSYKLAYSADCAVLSATGLINYEIELRAQPTRTRLNSPFGALDYTVRRDGVRLVSDNAGVTVCLRFTLMCDGEEDIVRDVTVSAEFCG